MLMYSKSDVYEYQLELLYQQDAKLNGERLRRTIISLVHWITILYTTIRYDVWAGSFMSSQVGVAVAVQYLYKQYTCSALCSLQFASSCLQFLSIVSARRTSHLAMADTGTDNLGFSSVATTGSVYLYPVSLHFHKNNLASKLLHQEKCRRNKH